MILPCTCINTNLNNDINYFENNSFYAIVSY